MRNLLFVSLFCWGVLSGCATARSGCRYAGECRDYPVIWKGIVDPSVGVNRFNMQIDIAKHHFSGLLLVKQTAARSHRAVFTTHFGMRVFDLEFLADSLIVHYGMEPVKKEKIIRLLKNDLSPLWGEQRQPDAVLKLFEDRKTAGKTVRVYQTVAGFCYREKLPEGRITLITSRKGWKKTSWAFPDFQTAYPSVVCIRHAFWPVKLELKRLD